MQGLPEVIDQTFDGLELRLIGHLLAFLDVMPLVEGHVLVIPKQEVDYIFDLDSELYQGLMVFSKKIAAAIKCAYPCKRIGLAVIGLEVPHAHIHLVPINTMNDMNFANDKLSYSKEEFIECAETIKGHL